MTKEPATGLVTPRRVAWGLVVIAALGLLPLGCDAAGGAKSRTLDFFVIQVDVLAAAGKSPLPLTTLAAKVEATRGLSPASGHRLALPEPPYKIVQTPASTEVFAGKATFYMLFPADFSAADIKTISFSMPGFLPLTIDYQSYKRVPYTPTETTSLSPNAKNPCADYNELGAFKFGLTLDSFLQYVSAQVRKLEATALAGAPSVPMCHLLFRQREEIHILLHPLS